MNKSPGELFRKRTTGWFLLSVIAFLNTVPLFVLSILANLSSVRATYSLLPGSHPLSYCKDCQLCSISRELGSVVPRLLQFYFWYTPPCRIRLLWFLLAYHDALALEIHGCFDALPSRPCSCGAIFCVLSDLSIDHIHSHRRWLQCVLSHSSDI